MNLYYSIIKIKEIYLTIIIIKLLIIEDNSLGLNSADSNANEGLSNG